LELGCGKGEYSVALARLHPERNFIGTDIKGASLWVGATEALREGLLNVAFLRTRIEFIRSCFGQGEVSEIWLTFPDPQPQKSRANKRLTSPRFLAAYREIMAADGVVRLKTDSQSLFDYTCEVVAAEGLPVRFKTADLYAETLPLPVLAVQTHYEKLFMQKGFSIKYLEFQINKA
jgi:tRNA (guanine-N7-)-methyltransferase